MSASAVLYLLGMAAIFAGERIVEEISTLRWLFDVAGVLTVGGAAVWRGIWMRRADDAGIAEGHRTALALTLVGAGSLALYVLSTDAAAEFLGFGAEAARRWTGSWSAIWPIVWICGTLPLVAVDRAIRNSPVVLPPRYVRQSFYYGLSTALALALVFPVNYLATQHSARWNLSYFETASAGSSTRALVDSLDEPVHVYAFFPPASEVSREIESFFAPLEGSKLTVHRLDQTAHPRVARALEVRRNGEIAFTNREVDPSAVADDSGREESDSDERVVETLRIPTDLNEAEEKLERLDQLARKHLTTVARGQRLAYLTTGHGEFSADRSARRQRRIAGFEKILEATGFRVESTGLGEGLEDGVPEDVDLVAVVGPSDPFLEAEIEALQQHFESGGALLVALEPAYSRRRGPGRDRGDPLHGLLERFGLELGDGILASERSIVSMANNKTDRLNLLTDQFSSHPSTATLSSAKLALFTPTAGHLETTEVSGLDRTMTVQSRSGTWVDRNGNLRYDEKEGESKQSRPIVAAIEAERSGEAPAGRALVAVDATLFSDLALRNRGNRQFVHDASQWLVGTPELTGGVNDEQDVRIRHTKQGQAVWFYGTVLGVPLLLFAAGAFRIWRRHGGSEA